MEETQLNGGNFDDYLYLINCEEPFIENNETKQNDNYEG
jgi:hypothetical protein